MPIPKKLYRVRGRADFSRGYPQKFFSPSRRRPIFPGPIRKIFSRISGEGDFSRRLPIPFFLAGCLSLFDFSRRCRHAFFPGICKIFLRISDGLDFSRRVYPQIFSRTISARAIFPGRYPLEFFWHQGKCDFSSGSQTVCSLLRLLTSRKH